jgi:CDP-diacylglycerol---glycerol-3-phosphate 3-phosphatidyltransferase
MKPLGHRIPDRARGDAHATARYRRRVCAALPNLLTAARGLAGPVVAWLVLGLAWSDAAFVVFLFAILTDLADGWLARRLGATSALGRLLDPLSDKALVTSTWLALGIVGWAPWWLAAPMLLRDLAVGVGWALLGRPDAPPSMTGRLKVSFEGVALPILLFRDPWLDVHWPSVGVALGAVALALSVASAILSLHAALARPAERGGGAAASEVGHGA